jgi:predicted polyphosphate/ATP-dependent NAD kinase
MGGRPALKGTDGPDILARARSLGALPSAPDRARRALARLAARAGISARVLAAPGVLGADAAEAAGLATEALGQPLPVETSAADTRRAAAALKERGVCLILFAGGDGTARDILAAAGTSVPLLGIPAGVKMHSALFAVSPEAAGDLAALVAIDQSGGIAYAEAEVMDIDEAGMREGRLTAKLHGYARVPVERHLMQGPKAGGPAEDDAREGLCREIAGELAPGVIHILGPGTTTQRILGLLGLEGTLLGVDAVLDGRLIGCDLPGPALAELVAGRPARIILSVIGGQGYTFGRGNQQIGPEVIRQVGRDNLILLASQAKILTLGENRLLADTGDRAVDALLSGYIRVRLAPRRSTMMRIET